MINIVEELPNEYDYALNENLINSKFIGALQTIEDTKIYYHFLYDIFLKSLDEYIRKNQTDKKGKLITSQETYKGDKEKESYFLYLKNLKNEYMSHVQIGYKNNSVRAKYVIDFDKSRKRFFLYENNIYSYSIQHLTQMLNSIIVHQWEQEDLIEILEHYAYIKDRSLFSFIIDKFIEIK